MKFTVIGAGHGGQALAGYIAYHGNEVKLYNRTASVLDGIYANGGINLEGIITSKITSIYLSNDMEDALADSDIIMICVPSFAHEEIAKSIAPFVNSNQTVILNPGRTLGAYYFEKYLKIYSCTTLPYIAETDTFLLTSRKISDGISCIFSVKGSVFIASADNDKMEQVCHMLHPLFPMLTVAESLVYTSLSNIGAIFHPIPAIFNIGKIENKEEYLHYKQGITPSICHLLEIVDTERLAIANALHVSIPSAKSWLFNVYGSNGVSLYESLQNTVAYAAIKAPTEINTRYIYEDIRTGLVPLYCLAHKLGTPCSTLKLIIDLATKMFDYDFYELGRHDVDEFLAAFKNR